MMKVPLDNVVALDQLEGREADQSLIDSIRENGILNPLKVYKYTFEGTPPLGISSRVYALLDGHRRLNAAQVLELEELPIEIMEKPVNQTEARVIQVILNRNRKDVKPSHVAESILAMKEAGKIQKEIAKRFGLSESEVSTYLTLQRGHEKIRKAVDSGRMSLSAAEPLLTKSLETQEALAEAAIRQRTVRRVRALVKTHEMTSDITAPDSQLEDDIDPLEYLALEAVKQAVSMLDMALSQPIKSTTITGAMIRVNEEVREKTKRLSDQLMDNILPF